MIVMGYPGIGKTTLTANINNRDIDLDSNKFNIKDPNRLKDYIQIARYLEKQKYIVFVSTHIEVGEELKKAIKEDSSLRVGVCYPIRPLKDLWLNKLKERYETTQNPIHKKAYDHCKEYYDSDIWYIEEGGYPDFELLPITSMTYEYFVHYNFNAQGTVTDLDLIVKSHEEE